MTKEDAHQLDKKHIEELYDEICALRNFEADVHYSIKHLRHLEKDIKFYTERLNKKYEDFIKLSKKYLNINEEDANEIINNIKEVEEKNNGIST